jgi:leucyl aminopeptidase
MNISTHFYNELKSKTNLFVAATFEGEANLPKDLAKLDSRAYELAKAAFAAKRFGGKEGEQFSSFDGELIQGNEFLLVGLGMRDKFSYEKLRKKIGSVFNYGKANHGKTIRILAETFAGGAIRFNDICEVLPETIELADYQFDKYITRDKEERVARKVETVELVFSKPLQKKLISEALERAQIVSAAVNFTRDLINEPANVMSPQELAAQARAVAQEGKMRVEVLGAAEIKKLGMGGVIAVSQGSHNPPQFIVLDYGSAYKKEGTICLVGKGVTFDTGGISLKPSKDMEKMKYDMSGAAAVLGIMKAIGQLRPKHHIVAIAPCVENMPGGGAQRPGDIIKMMNGKSVEVINTDAEGRLILADALAYTEKFKPKAVIDLATLTGACAVTFADKAIAVLGTDPRLIEKIRRAGEKVSERCWELPLWDEYFDIIKGHHSDIMNAGSGYGGTITAAMFLKEFVPVKSWAHLDIAGTAWVDGSKSYNVRGATAVGVRLVLELLRAWK